MSQTNNAPLLFILLLILMPYVVWATAGIERLTPLGYNRRQMLGMLRFGAVILAYFGGRALFMSLFSPEALQRFDAMTRPLGIVLLVCSLVFMWYAAAYFWAIARFILFGLPDSHAVTAGDNSNTALVKASPASVKRYRWQLGIALAAVALFAASAHRHSAKLWTGCQNAGQVLAPDAAIRDCTVLLNGGIAKPRERALVLMWRADALQRKTDYDASIVDYSRSIEVDGTIAASYHNRCMVYRAKSDFNRAIFDCTKAIQIDPNLASAYDNRGLAFYLMGNADAALRDYNKSVELNPRDGATLSDRAKLYLDTKQFGLALADYDRLVEMAPDYAAAYNSRAWGYFKAGRAQDGLPDADKAVELNPADANSLDTRASIYEALGRRDDAIADFKRAVAKDPHLQTSLDALQRLGVSL